MKSHTKNIFARPQPNGIGHQVSYETGTSRKVHQFAGKISHLENPPHGAGSFHDPEQHQTLMDRMADYIENIK